MNRWSIISIFLYICVHNSLQCQTIWKPVTVSNSSLINTTIVKQRDNSDAIACSIIASRVPLAKLFCIVDGACQISKFMAVPYPSQTPIDDPVECMTNIDGCLDGTNVIPLDHYYCPPSKTGFDSTVVYKCDAGVIVPLGRPPPQASCPSPYKNSTYGCILKSNGTRTWCAARTYCQSLGSDLLMLDSLTSKSQFKTFMDSNNQYSHLHFGMTSNGTYFEFLNGKPLFKNSTMWHAVRGGGTSPLCGVLYSDDGYASYGFAISSCLGFSLSFFCQIDLIT